MVLGHAFWASHFDRSVRVGSSRAGQRKPVTIVGGRRARVSGLGSDALDFWAPLEHHGDFVHSDLFVRTFRANRATESGCGAALVPIILAGADEEL